jgi:hypothetical protein
MFWGDLQPGRKQVGLVAQLLSLSDAVSSCPPYSCPMVYVHELAGAQGCRRRMASAGWGPRMCEGLHQCGVAGTFCTLMYEHELGSL